MSKPDSSNQKPGGKSIAVAIPTKSNQTGLTRTEREYEFFTDPTLLTRITKHIANGGSLINMAEMFDIRYGDIMQWIRSEAGRDKAYTQALADRAEWARERVLAELNAISYGLTEPDPDTGARSPAEMTRDRLRSIEMIMKNLSMLTEKHEVTGALTLDQLIMATQKIKPDTST